MKCIGQGESAESEDLEEVETETAGGWRLCKLDMRQQDSLHPAY